MKLYLYDHCPFCVSAEMAGHYKEVPFKTVYLLNDDEENCYQLVNAKQVPILEFDDGSAMPESLDIANKFDEIGNQDKIIRAQQYAHDVTNHINTAKLHISCLLYPRNIMAKLPEFATQSAKDYFQHKKEKSIKRSFKQALLETQEHKLAVETVLASLPALPYPSQNANTLGWDDILIYPILRNLTLVNELHFPASVLQYIEEVSQLTQTHTYFDRATI